MTFALSYRLPRRRRRRALSAAGFILLAVAALAGLVLLRTYIGFTNAEVNATAGQVTQLNLKAVTVPHWAGIAGRALSSPGVGTIYYNHTFNLSEVLHNNIYEFECLNPFGQKEMYFSFISNPDFNNLTVGNLSLVDSYLGFIGNETESANRTFIYSINVTVGTTTLSGVPAAYTWQNQLNESTYYPTGVLQDGSGNIVFVALVAITNTSYRADETANFQALFPVRNDSGRLYFWQGDPFDECPTGGVGAVFIASIDGFVVDNTTGLPVVNATIYVDNATTTTNASGYYNLTTFAGGYSMVAIASGYDLYWTWPVVVPENGTNRYNFSMIPSIAQAPTGFGYVRGVVLDNLTNATLANVSLSAAGVSTVSNGSGGFNLTLVAGIHNLVASLPGYEVNFATITILDNATTNQTMYLQPIQLGALLQNGTINGTVYDNVTNATLANVFISLAGRSTSSSANGTYNATVIEGTHILLALLSGYETYTASVNITANNATQHDIFLQPIAALGPVPAANGSVVGSVRDETTGTLLSNVTVSVLDVANVSDTLGFYNLTDVDVGLHYIVAIAPGYFIYANLTNVTAGNVTSHNISLRPFTEPGAGPGAGPGEGPGSGPGQGPGQGAGLGPGLGPGTGIIEQIGIDFFVSVKEINKKLTQGTFAEETVVFYNLGSDSKTAQISVSGDVEPFVRLDKDVLTVAANGTEDLAVTLLATGATGLYTGSLDISGDGNASLPITLVILPQEKLPIRALLLGVDLLKESLVAGETLRYKIDLRNLLTDIDYDVSLGYFIRRQDSIVETAIGEDEVTISTFLTLLNEFQLPSDTGTGDYIFTARASYLNLTSSVSTPFRVVLPFYRYAVFGVIPLWLLLAIVLSLALLTYGVLEYRRLQLAKRRYVVSVDYGLLPKAGPRSIFVGKVAESERKAYFDMDQFTTHAIIAGSTGGGKSITAQVLVEEMLLRNIAVVVFDPTAQWSGMLRKLNSPKMLANYPRFGMRREEARAFNGNIKAITNAREKIDLPKFIRPGEIQIFTLNTLDPRDIDVFVANTVRTVFRANFPEAPELKVLLVYDEVHRLLPRFGGSGQGFVQIERACREFRKWGLGVMLVSQVLSDFVGEIKANINTEIQMRTRDEGDLDRIKTKYGEELLQSLVKSEVGTGMVVNTASNRGNPYFLSFRPILHSIQRLSDEELAQYNKYNAIIEDLDYQIQQLEGLGVDVFDLRLELKLALDKIKSGNFNMVEIYLESLTPRITDSWRKLGKTPKKREVELVAEEELKAELKKAQEERAKLVKQEAAAPREEKVLKFKKHTTTFLTFNSGAAVSSLEELRDALSTMGDDIFRDHVNDQKHEVADWVKDDLEFPGEAERLRKLRSRQEILAELARIEKSKEEVVLAPPKAALGPEPSVQTERRATAVDPRLREIARHFALMDRLLKQGRRREAFEVHKRINALYQRLPQDVRQRVYRHYIELYRRLRGK